MPCSGAGRTAALEAQAVVRRKSTRCLHGPPSNVLAPWHAQVCSPTTVDWTSHERNILVESPIAIWRTRLLDLERSPLLAGEQPDEKDAGSDGEEVAQVADNGADRDDEAKAEREQSRRNQPASDDEQRNDASSRPS